MMESATLDSVTMGLPYDLLAAPFMTSSSDYAFMTSDYGCSGMTSPTDYGYMSMTSEDSNSVRSASSSPTSELNYNLHDTWTTFPNTANYPITADESYMDTQQHYTTNFDSQTPFIDFSSNYMYPSEPTSLPIIPTQETFTQYQPIHQPNFSTATDFVFQACQLPAQQLGDLSAKPKRKRVQTKPQRKAANVRERKRMCSVNSAFDVLKTRVPTFSYEKRLSRIETLKLAIDYISFMTDVLSGKNPDDVTLSRYERAAKVMKTSST